MTLNQQPSNCRLITANDPVLASNFTMQPTFKIADKKVVLRDHNYIAVKDFVLSRSFMHCIRCQEKLKRRHPIALEHIPLSQISCFMTQTTKFVRHHFYNNI